MIELLSGVSSAVVYCMINFNDEEYSIRNVETYEGFGYANIVGAFAELAQFK